MAVVFALTAAVGLRDAAAQKAAPGAKTPDPKEQARTLFKEGASAVEAKRFEEGLQKLEQAEALFHAPTHVLFIARAQVGLKRYLAAKASYEKLTSETLPPKTSDVFVDAQKSGKAELAELVAKIPKIVLRVAPSQPPDLAITMNGEAVSVTSIGTPIEVEPGSYVFEAKGGGLVSGRVTVDAAERTTSEVKLVLSADGTASTSQISTTAQTASGDWPPMKIASLPLMILGGAGLAVGGAMGALHFVRGAEADDKFDTCGSDCRTEVEDLDKQSALFGNVAIGALAGGAALLATGVVLFILAPSGPSDEAAPDKTAIRVRVSPTGLGIDGTF